MSRIVNATDQSIKEAARIIKAGGLAAFPTETVYGLGANALDGRAVAKIFAAKGRPQFNPLITHFADIEPIGDYAKMEETANILAHHFWPGPLTMIVPRKEGCAISQLVSAGLPTLAVRVPSHRVARDLINAAGVPICAPSANISGTLSPTTPEHVAESLGDKADIILAGGLCEGGLESTVVDLSAQEPVILRPGLITAEDISSVLERNVSYDFGEGKEIKSPGQILKHYAPSISMRMNAIDLAPGEALLAFGPDKFMGIKSGGAAKDLPETQRRNLSEKGDLYEAAANLFAMLHALDRPEHSGIAVMAVPDEGLGVAINDRLKRAASSR